MSNEYERLFFDDIRQKKQTAQGARHRATRGRGKVTVRNQSDHLTKKELENMSGVCVSFMNKPMNWKEFKLQPAEVQKKYIEYLRTEYGANACMIADMLGVTRAYFCKMNKATWNIDFQNSVYKNERKWKKFLNPVEETVEAVEETVEEVRKTPSVMDHFSIRGTDAEEVLSSMKALMSFLVEGSIYVDVKVVE